MSISSGPFGGLPTDSELRIEALRQAVIASEYFDDSEITAAAKKFYKFLSGKRS